ncbi:uncharacterized protein LOC132927184 [Rhopalosiphum padi]|uniref:uncharacterized protein LOC132927184 n=1 Tax=Rhopalosiphum padi TaxID=40932 RepID=UPI00298DB136|nr:uncharacterized protein LOC132927184 [Rhopalosiphum padi]
MVYKNNNKMLLLIYCCVWFPAIVLNARGEITIHSNNSMANKDYDVTTIYRITNEFIETYENVVGFADSEFYEKYSKNSYSIEIHSRTNAIGLPIFEDVGEDFLQKTNQLLQINKLVFLKYGLFENNSHFKVDYFPKNWDIKSTSLIGKNCNFGDRLSDQCINIFEYRYDKEMIRSSNDFTTIYSVIWTADKHRSGLSITYMHTSASKMDIFLNLSYANNTLITFSKLLKFDDVRTITFNEIGFTKNQEYILSLKMNMNNDYYHRGRYNFMYHGFWFGLVRIAESSNYDEEDVRIVYNFEGKPKSFDVLGNNIKYNITEEGIVQKSECLNGGYKLPTMNNCTCPPGFIGKLCETACGPNSYGFDCKGVCSMHDHEMCRGMYMCTSFGCTCPPGLTGPLCNKNCESGTFGADCKQLCSPNCYDNACDPYTGVCTEECSEEYYVEPYCLQKYPYLLNPPKLLSSEYESLEIICDFQSSNVMGEDKNIKLKYFQIVYKMLGEQEFTNSVIKPIIERSNTSNEILSDLKVDTVYLVGVLLITDDGNFNDQDIVYGQFQTSCIPPKIDDFNVTLLSGVKSINVTWNKINTIGNRFECNIIEYLLMLSCNQSQNQIHGVQKIVSHSIGGHNISDLIPDCQYDVQLVLNTTQGLFPSPVYSVTPLTGNEFRVKDITTVVENGKIKVSWKLGYIYERYNTMVQPVVNEPITYYLRYKIKRILSCALRDLRSDWETVIISNQTNYEILNVIPNSQYYVQVSSSPNQRTQTKFILTSASKPNVVPDLDLDNPMYVTNSSVFVQWKFNSTKCSRLNGLFSTYIVELKEKSNNYLQVKETKKNNILIENLKSNTQYELKVFIKTHVGYTPENFLFINFTTEIGVLGPVEDLVVYKNDLKNKVIGLRWRYPENSSVDGFIVSFKGSFNSSFIKHDKNVTIVPPIKCSAWPEYFCYTFYDVIASNDNTFNIQAKSPDCPQGGLFSSVTFADVDGSPDPPRNVKIIDIGITYIRLQWDIPWIFNGTLKMFTINTEETANVYIGKCCVYIEPIEVSFDEEVPSYNYTLTGLQPGSTYSIGILSATTSLEYSSTAKVDEVTTLRLLDE